MAAAFAIMGKSIPHACGGEPLYATRACSDQLRIPHACGGEPGRVILSEKYRQVFPTHVGVNRIEKW